MTHTFITTGKLLASSLVIAMAFSSTAMAQAKSSTTTPQTDVNNAQPNAISYGSTRSNTKQIATPTGETPDVGDVLPNAISYGSTRSNTKNVAAPAGNTGTAENGTTRANINTSRSGKLNNTIAAPADVTPDIGDAIKPVRKDRRSKKKQAQSDGVDDAAQSR